MLYFTYCWRFMCFADCILRRVRAKLTYSCRQRFYGHVIPDSVSSWTIGHVGQYSRTSRTISHLRQCESQSGKYFLGDKISSQALSTLDVEQYCTYLNLEEISSLAKSNLGQYVIRIISLLGDITSRTGQFLLFSRRISHLRKYLIPDRVSAQIMSPLGPYLIPGR